MKISFITFSFSLFLIFNANAQMNITRLSAWYANGQTLAGCWHYADSVGHEYALIGARDGIMILDVTNPSAPNFLFQLPGYTNLWHEIKVSGKYAYAVSEAIDPDTLRDGLQIINLSYLPDSAPNYFWHTDGIMTDLLKQAHSITVDDNYIYINGHSVPNHGHGVLILDKSDPWNPVYKGVESVRYCHDSFVRGDTLWTSDIQDGMFSVYDITDRTNPVLLATQQTPLQFNHNAWLSDDSRFLFTTDERQGAPIGSFDISDLSNITLVDEYYTSNMLPSEAHNVRVLNDYIINASYGSQVTIIDATHPDNLIEVGNYPTGSGLCWDADPYLPSGILIATDTQTDSMYLLQPNYMRACYFTGTVTDSMTGILLPNTKVDIDSLVHDSISTVHDSTNLTGVYKTGYVIAGNYSATFSRPGYFSKTFSIQLSNGIETVLDVQLVDSTHNGVNELNEDNWIQIKNNPSLSEIKLELSSKFFDGSATVSLAVSDRTGRIVFEQKNISDKNIILSKNNFAAGSYFFSITNEKGITGNGKLIFQ